MTVQAIKIYLTLPKVINQSFLRPLQTVCEETPIACLMLPQNQTAYDDEILDKIVHIAHNCDTACLLENDYQKALKFGMDGIHIIPEYDIYCNPEEPELNETIEYYHKARECLGDDAIIGISCYDRHGAMTFGELGAQYIAFGKTGCDRDEYDLNHYLKWWSELFEVPSVAWDINDLSQIEPLLSSGADFICLGDFIWSEGHDANSIIKSIALKTISN